MTFDEIKLEGIKEPVRERVSPFLLALANSPGDIHSIYIVGSSLTSDYNEKKSDINSVIILREFSFAFTRFLAGIGGKHKGKGLAPPLIMTPRYIERSLDAFPIEFFNFRLIHKPVYGEDIISGLHIEDGYLRLQCEREIKAKLIGLRQGYISSLGDRALISAHLINSITGSIPMFRVIIHLLKKRVPIERHSVVVALKEVTGNGAGIFDTMLSLKAGELKPSKDGLDKIFEDYYQAIESLGRAVDELTP
ncbi:MAG: hypothetical protein HY954_04300 [Deltaproteobacteria bacterium]|nr:hypothetical protein [Deltaproteobacteria bacterium]